MVGIDPCYNLSYKKECFLLIKIDKVAIFLYKPKPSEFPRVGPLETYDIDQETIDIISASI
jgi:hypothetical protein